jgi:adenine phosphoribosyltransferase
MAAVVELVKKFGVEIYECVFMAELKFLNGRSKLPDGKVYSLLQF